MAVLWRIYGGFVSWYLTVSKSKISYRREVNHGAKDDYDTRMAVLQND